jgi:two-component system, chemotaxis family, chemotaxis protein CheY
MAPRILIVDDSRLTRSIIRGALLTAGFEIAGEATRGQDGVDMYFKVKPDLVTMDLTMPDAYGMESMREILTRDPLAKVLVITALNQRLLVEDALKIGAKGMIAKPFQPYELVKAVSHVVGAPPIASPVPLSSEELDGLVELGNIGIGNAASRLSDLVGHRCLMDIPKPLFLDAMGLHQLLDTKDAFAEALQLKIMGDVSALMFVVTKRLDAELLVSYMTNALPASIEKDLSARTLLALKHIGEVLTKAFSDAICTFLSARARCIVPDVYVEGWSSALDDIVRRLESPAQERLVLKSAFFNPEKSFQGTFVYVLDQQSQRLILSRTKLLLLGVYPPIAP